MSNDPILEYVDGLNVLHKSGHVTRDPFDPRLRPDLEQPSTDSPGFMWIGHAALKVHNHCLPIGGGFRDALMDGSIPVQLGAVEALDSWLNFGTDPLKNRLRDDCFFAKSLLGKVKIRRGATARAEFIFVHKPSFDAWLREQSNQRLGEQVELTRNFTNALDPVNEPSGGIVHRIDNMKSEPAAQITALTPGPLSSSRLLINLQHIKTYLTEICPDWPRRHRNQSYDFIARELKIRPGITLKHETLKKILRGAYPPADRLVEQKLIDAFWLNPKAG